MFCFFLHDLWYYNLVFQVSFLCMWSHSNWKFNNKSFYFFATKIGFFFQPIWVFYGHCIYWWVIIFFLYVWMLWLLNLILSSVLKYYCIWCCACRLGDVLSSLTSKKDAIPYENSMLTKVLADSLGILISLFFIVKHHIHSCLNIYVRIDLGHMTHIIGT